MIWITGASSGIGEELAVQLAAVGCRLVLSATREKQLEDVKRRCLSVNTTLKSHDVLCLKLDVTDYKSHRKALELVIEHFGRIDILVNNAGRYQVGLFEDR